MVQARIYGVMRTGNCSVFFSSLTTVILMVVPYDLRTQENKNIDIQLSAHGRVSSYN